ncbi:glutathione S-transferase family protein [Thalassotalea psychrophila]|uniref:Glutathione S-transferase family protein n=1 Tax=Thalassotalea psychrophila TaxID=3065647 RepID=A0ABY9TXL6_9GAMM|nr:glutathione S-transferase family protein [Colwelliaceae bacterium SQ149]
MTQLKISYFDVDGGRAEPIRLAFHLGGVAFEDHRFPYPDFPQEAAKTPLGQVPVLYVDDVLITQSSAILRYAGKLTHLYPTDLYQALICDEVIDVAEDIINKIVPTMFLEGDAQKAAREELAQTGLPKYLSYIESKLVQQGGQYFAENKLSIADLKVMSIIGWLNSGGLDHLPTDLVAQIAPQLNQHLKLISSNTDIANYYASR